MSMTEKKETPDKSEVSFGAGSRIRTYEGRRPTDLQSVAFNHFAIPAFNMEPRVRFELTTCRLQGDCSTN